MPSPAPPPATGSSLQERLNDFPSWLSPMLVKELRQGLRTHLFVTAFLLLQAFMILCLVANLANPGANPADGLFWFLIVSILLIVQPLRGFNALSSEHQLNTIELIQLTRLDGWRITLGKWTALNAQGLLFVTGVLPYLVIRYFIGNVDFLGDLAKLGAIALGSALLTSATIGCSVFRHIALRGILIVGLAFCALAIYNVIEDAVFGAYGGASSPKAGALLAFASLYGICFFLAFGASRLAPLSENHATAKRLVALGFALAVQLFHFWNLEEAVYVATAVILACACVDALTEPLPILSRVLVPFSHPAKRPFALFLLPGWMSGIFFTLLCGALLVGTTELANRFFVGATAPIEDARDLVLFLCAVNLLLFPLLIIQLFFPQLGSRQHTFGLYLFIQGGLFIATLLILAIGSAIDAIGSGRDWVYYLAPIPSVLIGAQSSIDLAEPGYFALSLGLLFVCVTFPLLRQRAHARGFFAGVKTRTTAP